MITRVSVAVLSALMVSVIFVAPLSATTITSSWIGGGTLTMDYSFTVGQSYNTFSVQSVSVTNNDPTSGYYGLFPEHTLFTGFTPLLAPACSHSVCLYDFGVLNKGEAAGYNPFPVWAWFGSEQSFGTDLASGATLGIFNVVFYTYGQSGGFLADSAGSFSLLLADGTRTGLDFNLGTAGPDPSSVPGPIAGTGPPAILLATGVLLWRRQGVRAALMALTFQRRLRNYKNIERRWQRHAESRT